MQLHIIGGDYTRFDEEKAIQKIRYYAYGESKSQKFYWK